MHRHCFRLLLGPVHVLGEIANDEYAKFGGVKEVLYGIVQVVNYVLLRHNDLIRDEIRVIAPHTESKKLQF